MIQSEWCLLNIMMGWMDHDTKFTKIADYYDGMVYEHIYTHFCSEGPRRTTTQSVLLDVMNKGQHIIHLQNQRHGCFGSGDGYDEGMDLAVSEYNILERMVGLREDCYQTMKRRAEHKERLVEATERSDALKFNATKRAAERSDRKKWQTLQQKGL